MSTDPFVTMMEGMWNGVPPTIPDPEVRDPRVVDDPDDDPEETREPERVQFLGYIAKGQAWHLDPRCRGAKTATEYTITGAAGLTLEEAQDKPVNHTRPVTIKQNGQRVEVEETVELQPCGLCTARPKCIECQGHYGERGQNNLGYARSFCSIECRDMYEKVQQIKRDQAEVRRMQPYLDAAAQGLGGYVIAPKGVRYHKPDCESFHRHAYSVEPLLSLRVMRWDDETKKRVPTTLLPCSICKPEPITP